MIYLLLLLPPLIDSRSTKIARDSSDISTTATATAYSKKVESKSNQPPLLLMLRTFTSLRHDIPKASRILIVDRQRDAIGVHLVPSMIIMRRGSITVELWLAPLRAKVVVTIWM